MRRMRIRGRRRRRRGRRGSRRTWTSGLRWSSSTGCVRLGPNMLHAGPVESLDGGFRWRVQVEGSGGGFGWRIQVEGSGGGIRWRVRGYGVEG